MPALSEFPWPCDKREAHGPHEVVVEPCDHTRLTCEEIGCPGPVTKSCPGVDAHPLTQMGGKWTDDR